MTYATQPIPFPARYDYGSRVKYPTLGFVVHMAEGVNVAQFLSRNPARGVSVPLTDMRMLRLRGSICTSWMLSAMGVPEEANEDAGF